METSLSEKRLTALEASIVGFSTSSKEAEFSGWTWGLGEKNITILGDMVHQLGMETKPLDPRIEKPTMAFIEADLNQSGSSVKVTDVLSVTPGKSGKEFKGVVLVEVLRKDSDNNPTTTLIYSLGTRLNKALKEQV